MGKRGATGYSFVIGIDKPYGLTSHDVVNRVRRVFGERRVGHTGTLDPAATGAMAVCVGPAARLDRFLTAHDKSYEFTIVFGRATDTDDAQGATVAESAVPAAVRDEAAARACLAAQRGRRLQKPPAYSAIKVNGKKSYEAARRGNVIELDARPVEIHSMELLGMEDAQGAPAWRVRALVSAGTYVRSIARDTGRAMGTVAHVGELRRLSSGLLRVEDCATLEELEANPFGALLDPLKLLGMRFAFARGPQAEDIRCGRPVPVARARLFAYHRHAVAGGAACGCASGVHPADGPLEKGELVAFVVDGELKAIYEYDAGRGALKSACGFAVGVRRFGDI